MEVEFSNLLRRGVRRRDARLVVVILELLAPVVRRLRAAAALPLHLRDHARVEVVLRVLVRVQLRVGAREILAKRVRVVAHHHAVLHLDGTSGVLAGVDVTPRSGFEDALVHQLFARQEVRPEGTLAVLPGELVFPRTVGEDAVVRKPGLGNEPRAERHDGVLPRELVFARTLGEDALVHGADAVKTPVAAADVRHRVAPGVDVFSGAVGEDALNRRALLPDQAAFGNLDARFSGAAGELGLARLVEDPLVALVVPDREPRPDAALVILARESAAHAALIVEDALIRRVRVRLERRAAGDVRGEPFADVAASRVRALREEPLALLGAPPAAPARSLGGPGHSRSA